MFESIQAFVEGIIQTKAFLMGLGGGLIPTVLAILGFVGVWVFKLFKYRTKESVESYGEKVGKWIALLGIKLCRRLVANKSDRILIIDNLTAFTDAVDKGYDGIVDKYKKGKI